jgi:single-strand DNA-binding protein
MASLNRCTFIGNLGRDPDIKVMPNGDTVTNISIACTDSWKDKQTGEKREATEWVRVVFFRKLAEIAGQYLKKGSSVYIEGKMVTRKWTDKDGTERYATEIVADEMKMLGGRADAVAAQPSQNTAPIQGKLAKPQSEDFGDIPF